ncbi:HEXXH motif domain-containing protein [Micromonospora sp. NPDC000668]|uniref:HEXXH motif domain-containing protein n=1 Tax=Micromonospora sp. NPDC000668 TaxID=3364219 RepID=UPI003698A716
MTPAGHRLPRSILDDLAKGQGGSASIELLRAAQHSKNLMLVRALVVLTHRVDHPDRAAVEAAYRMVGGLTRDQRRAAWGHPPVAAWAFGTASLLRRGGRAAAYPGLLAAVAAAAAVRARADADLDLPLNPATPGRLDLPGLGTLRVDPTATRARVRCAGGRAEVRCAGERIEIGYDHVPDHRWRPFPELRATHGGLSLRLLLDTGTWRHVPTTVEVGAHPIAGPVSDPGRWLHRLRGAWRLLTDEHRAVAEELAAALCALVPLAAPRAGVRSGTFHHGFGSVAMSLPPDARSTAVTLAHEIQHLKLAGLTDLFPLVEPGPEESFYAPWRPDPRPLDGLLHGAYAHLGVAGFWRRQRLVEHDRAARHHAEVEFARWTRAAGETVQVLTARPRLTTVGRCLVDGMAPVLDRWAREPVTPDAAAEAGQLLAAHRARWDRERAGARPA